jgi:small subunit ribosomal protein S21
MSIVINAEVRPHDGEPFERLLKRFSKKVKKLGIMEEIRESEYFKKPSVKRRLAEKKRKQILRKLKSESQIDQ